MLTIWMPEDREGKRKRLRWQALGYVIAGLLIITSTFLAYTTQVWYLPYAVEAWWFWAVISTDWGRNRALRRPRSTPLTVLHVHDEDREADLRGRKERIGGWTWCDLPFNASELWVPVEYRQGDRICPACMRKRNRIEP